jgi:hypothetical protein
MEERPFSDENSEPTKETLKKVLGNAYPYYETLMNIPDSFSKDWNFFKSSGWMLKVHERKKALFYLVPLDNGFNVSMAIRENERKVFLKDDELKTIHNMLKSAKQYREGFELRFDVIDDADFEIVESLIKKLTDIRLKFSI